MEILFHLLILFFVEVMMISVAEVLDGFSVVKKGKRLNVKFPFFRAKKTKKRTVSRLSYIFQICNIIYVIIFIAFAILDSYISSNPFFCFFNFCTGIALFILSFPVIIVLSFKAGIAYEDPKEDDSKTKNDQTENALDN